MLLILLGVLILHLIILVLLLVSTIANAWTVGGTKSTDLWYSCLTTNGGYHCSSASNEDSRYRITHQQRTKQRRKEKQQENSLMDSWTWEQILDGEGPWTQAGEYRLPQWEIEAARAERRYYEERERNKHER
ncbi:uncharacterized protein isoform X2 [Salmo salar]|uniref:Uncharacterized protein isoform X2 n=1 Tax=Salmo salar TaxID=8030 RepID=A0ABM3EL08_SALSA|nr:uncharacterized protein LOC106602029 isoform X2 [Salmo salar]